MHDSEKSLGHCGPLIETVRKTLRELGDESGSEACQSCGACLRVDVRAVRIENLSNAASDSTTVTIELQNLKGCLNSPLNPQNN